MAEPEPSAATQAAIGASALCVSLAGTLLTIHFLKRFGAFELVATGTVGIRPANPDQRTGNVIDLFPIRR